MSGTGVCFCTVTFSEEGSEGTVTGMEYKGKGIFVCPKCNSTEDISKNTYIIKVKIEKIDGCMEAKITDDADWLKHHWKDDTRYCIIKDTLEETLNNIPYDYDCVWLNNHEEGIFEIELYYSSDEYMTDCGMEYDEYAEILSEKKL